MTGADRSGFALIGALWLVVAIAVVSADAWWRFEAGSLLAQNLGEAPGARLAAEAGLAAAHAALQERLERQDLTVDGRRLVDPWSEVSGRTDSSAVGTGGRNVTTVTELDALLPLNVVDERELTNFLTTAGADVSTAQTIAQSIMDWRDSDGLYRARGAEGAWYRSRGYAVLPANGPFGDVTELRHVRGVSAETYAVIAPMIAVTGDGRVNLNTAPAPVMAALPGLSPSAATRIETLRASGRQFSSVYDVALRLPQAERESIEARLPALVARTTFETERVLVESRGRTTGGRITHTAFALFERQGGTAYRTWVRHAR